MVMLMRLTRSSGLTNELIQRFSQERLLLSWTPSRPLEGEEIVFSLDALGRNYTKAIPHSVEFKLADTKSSWDTTFTAANDKNELVRSSPIMLSSGMYLVKLVHRLLTPPLRQVLALLSKQTCGNMM